MRYITIDDDTGAFLHVEDIRACIPVDDGKQEESGYRTIIMTPSRDLGSTLDCTQLRARISNALGIPVGGAMQSESRNTVQ